MSQKRPKIVKMSIDSLVQTTLVKLPDGHMPFALALNYDTQVLYWADSGNDSLHSIGTNGSNMRIIVPDLKLTLQIDHSFPQAMSYLNGYIYWTDMMDKCIRKTNVMAGIRSDGRLSTTIIDLKRVNIYRNAYPMGIQVIDATRQKSKCMLYKINYQKSSSIILLSLICH